MNEPTTVATELPVYMRRDGFDPVPELAASRAEIGRITTPFGIDAWVISRYEDVRAVLGDAERFSNARLVVRPPGISDEELARLKAGNILALDPPEHGRLRRMLTGQFTVSRMRRLEPRIRAIVTDHLDALERGGAPADLVPAFALPVPSLVICELLGVPYADRDEFQERTGRLLDTSLPIDERLRLNEESRQYMATLVARAQAEPGDDLLGLLVREHGAELGDDELTGIAGLLLIAGHETTSNMLGLGTLALLRHPDQLALVRQDDTMVEPAIEELMRWLSIVHTATMKVVTTDVVLGGRQLREGDVVLCALPAANRDPDALADPDRLDVTRGAMGHLAFGHGVHHCLGAPLARMEMRIAFPELLRRFPGLAEVPGGAEFRSAHVVYGLSRLPVTW